MTHRLIVIIAMMAGIAMGMKAQGDLDAKYAIGLLAPGTEAPDFTIANAGAAYDGTSLVSLRGKYVVLDFWASWCPDCRKDIGTIREMNARLGSDSIVFVGMSFDKSDEAWRKCVADSAMTWMQHREQKPWKETQVAKDYHVDWIPTMYLIGPDGRVVLGTVMTEKIEKALETLALEAGKAEVVGRKDVPVADVTADQCYKGGRKALMAWMARNIEYPERAVVAGAEGTVTLMFTLTANGKLKDIKAADCRVNIPDTYGKYSAEERKTLNEELARSFASAAYRVLKKSEGQWLVVPTGTDLSLTLPVTFSQGVKRQR